MSDEPPQRRVLPSRANRGSMMAALIANTEPVVPKTVEPTDEEYEKFWQASMLGDDEDEEFDEEDDDDTQQHDYQIDDDSESENDAVPDEDEETEKNEKKLAREERQAKRKQKKSVYVDKAKATKAKATTTPKKRERKPASTSDEQQPSSDKSKDEKMTTRASTKHRTQLTKEKEEMRNLGKRKTKKRVYKEPTQKERLEQAKITAAINTQSLEYLLNREEAQKKKVSLKRKGNEIWFDEPYNKIPRLTYYSKNGASTLVFNNFDDETLEYDDDLSEYYRNRLQNRVSCGFDDGKCVVTGEKAKYKEPKSKLPCASLSAYKVIAEAWKQYEKLVEDPSKSHLDFVVYLSSAGVAKHLNTKFVEDRKKKEDEVLRQRQQMQQMQQQQHFIQQQPSATTEVPKVVQKPQQPITTPVSSPAPSVTTPTPTTPITPVTRPTQPLHTTINTSQPRQPVMQYSPYPHQQHMMYASSPTMLHQSMQQPNIAYQYPFHTNHQVSRLPMSQAPNMQQIPMNRLANMNTINNPMGMHNMVPMYLSQPTLGNPQQGVQNAPVPAFVYQPTLPNPFAPHMVQQPPPQTSQRGPDPSQ